MAAVKRGGLGKGLDSLIPSNTSTTAKKNVPATKADKPEVIEKIKKSSEEEIKRIINEAIDYSKELKTDIFNIVSFFSLNSLFLLLFSKIFSNRFFSFSPLLLR